MRTACRHSRDWGVCGSLEGGPQPASRNPATWRQATGAYHVWASSFSGESLFPPPASNVYYIILSVHSKSICWAPYYVPVTVTGDRSEKNSERGQSSWPMEPAARWGRQTSKWAGRVASGCQKFCVFCAKNLALVSHGFRRRSLQFCLSGTRWFSSRKGPTVDTFHHPRQVFPRRRRDSDFHLTDSALCLPVRSSLHPRAAAPTWRQAPAASSQAASLRLHSPIRKVGMRAAPI